MKKFSIVVNSSVDLTEALRQEFDLVLAPLKFIMNGKEYINYLDYRTLGVKEFYQKLREGVVATTLQVNIVEYVEIIESEFKKGNDVLILSLSSALSSNYNSARIAADMFKDHATNKVYLIDTLSASLGEGLIAYAAAMKRKEGATIEETYRYVEQIKYNVAAWFTVDDLMFLRRGGRLGGVSAVFGTLLAIKPILHVDLEGRLVPMEKTRGRKKALRIIADKVKETYDPKLPNIVYIAHGDDEDSANLLKEMIEELDIGLQVTLINYVGPVIGAHAGPGTVGVFFFAKHR
ncbi:MAG: DegV domain-containing protein [Tenericutes bacterium ADurb.Bin239]|nr:MAG: DegV domain-containing protein [Tenericutes bacterium ADurb.Bin239]